MKKIKDIIDNFVLLDLLLRIKVSKLILNSARWLGKKIVPEVSERKEKKNE